MVVIAYTQEINYEDAPKVENRLTIFDTDEEFVKWYSYMWKDISVFAITRK